MEPQRLEDTKNHKELREPLCAWCPCLPSAGLWFKKVNEYNYDNEKTIQTRKLPLG